MLNRSLVFVFFFSCFLGHVNAQKIATGLKAPDNWRSEILPFPLEFAPEIALTGFEDVLFAPGWADKDSEAFWTYHFTWFIDLEEPMSVDFLEKNIKMYFDGLANAVLKGNTDNAEFKEPDPALCLFIKTAEGFQGKLRVFDPFFTKDAILLNVKVKEVICKKSNKQIVSFNISPKGIADPIWNLFDGITTLSGCN